MYLKKIEITGFKSFTERTRLHFEPGITAIVGPNGCGKSNVVDAVQWCLGEQSTRSLRCQNMMDVIFNGSQKRASMGMAEVSLVFDNSNNRIPLDFNEIIVTRKLFRSGESEYYLNKVQCRLKDIKNLFLDTGIGHEGYSIMEQGKIEFILNAKPEERRELFEEAAGVAKYKAHRDEALRKMEKVEFDLLRIQDTIGIVKDQIRQLDLAARKARQYKSGMEELKHIEISDFLHQKKQLDESISTVKATLTQSQDSLSGMTSSLDRNEARLEELRLIITEKEKTFSEIQEAAYKIDSEIALCENRTESARKRIEELQHRKTQLMKEIESESEKLVATVSYFKSLFQELTDLYNQKGILESELGEKERILNEESSKIEDKKREHEGIKNSLYEKEHSLTEIHNILFQISSGSARISGEQYSLEKEYAKLAERDIQLSQDLPRAQEQRGAAHTRREESLSQQQINCTKSLEIKNNCAQYQQRDDELNQKQLKICARISALTEQLEADPYHRGALALLSREWKGIFGPLHRLIRFPEEYRYLIFDGFGDYLSFFVSETIAEAEHALQYLKEQQLGRARFFVLETLPYEIAPPLHFITSEKPLIDVIQYEPRIENLIRFVLQSTYFKGSTIYRDHSIEGGAEYAPDVYTVGTGTLQEKDILESQLEDLRNKRSQNQELIENLISESDRMQNRIKELNDIVRQHEISFSLTETNVQKIQEEFHTVSEEMKIVFRELQNFFTQIRDLDNTCRQNREKQSVLDEDIAQVRSSLSGAELDLASMSSAVGQLNDETNNLRIRFSPLVERVQHKQGEKERIETQHCDMARAQVIREEECSNSERYIQEQHDSINHEQKTLDAMFKQKETGDSHLRNEANERNRLQEEMHRLIESIHEYRQEVIRFRTETQNIEIDYQKHLFQEKNIRHNLAEKYQLDFEQAFSIHQPQALDEEKAAKLRARISSFGAVNLAAPEEYIQLEGRYSFLEKQYQDIIQAKEDLRRVIQKINATTKENFSKTFHQVRENFKKIYQILFQGGEAELTLTNEENLLETGVDIFAQPPGKKLQNISLLSGGEKALTAVALLFAFFMVKPSPLCILDEVDAPLDEANIQRFIRMIKDFSKDTQFLVITHNKRTMEIADILYGITMEDYGVSKVISIKFEEKHQHKEQIDSSTEPATIERN